MVMIMMMDRSRQRRIGAKLATAPVMTITMVIACALGASLACAQTNPSAPGAQQTNTSANAAATAPTKGTANSTAKPIQKGAIMSGHASGPFDVKLVPEAPEDKAEGSTLGRMSIDKQYHGDLEATGKGEMLTAGTGVKGSAGYVAIERVTGTLNGRKGSFVLQHSATLTRGAPDLNIFVVPDSGTGELTGISGKLNVIIAPGGKHSYTFDYTLPESR